MLVIQHPACFKVFIVREEARIKGRMTSGFALVAWPVKYGDTGVMSFIVSHAGQVYERNLGPNTDASARAMTLFDPDSSWRKVSQ